MIRDVMRRFSEARNAKDAAAAAAFFTEDADFGTSKGDRIEGKKNIEKRFATSFDQSGNSAANGGTADGRIDLSTLNGSTGFILNGIAVGDYAGRRVGGAGPGPSC